ncbi:MAG: demethoxyubiquinone hydroxylase family protein, partial [Gammaproteobacteria bacterium CG22_combo_CG10-13_8_21_14_all_40_8]
MSHTQLSFLDKCCLSLDVALRTLSGHPKTTQRRSPASSIVKSDLTPEEARQTIGLMRINHCGEVCAQALYQGQAMTAKLVEVKKNMELAALEENDHLAWCRHRVEELGSHTSYLDPIFYFGSFTIGSIAGLIGDKWSLGFVAETEQQVVRHLEEHLSKLPATDAQSKAILETMREDEHQHAVNALAAGGAELPQAIQKWMRLTSKLMTHTTYY